MFEPIIEILKSAGTLTSPVVIVPAWQGGVILRFGRWHRTLTPGYYWKIPFFEDVVLAERCETTMRLPPQSLTTKDDVSVVVSSIVKYEIRDMKKYVCDVWDQKDVLADVTMGAIAQCVRESTYKDLMDGVPDKEVLTKVKRGVGKYGFEVNQVTFTDRSRARSIRLVVPNAKDLDN